MSVNVLLYKYYDKPNIIQKSISSTGRLTLEGTFKDDFNIYNPVLRVRVPSNIQVNDFLKEYSYVNTQLPNSPRYYFIVDKTIINNSVIDLHLKLDVLTTYATAIRNAIGTLIESAEGNKYLSTYDKIFDVRKNFQKIEFSSGFNNDENLILITTKGKITKSK